MRIAVVGAGGVGGYFGALLARAGHDVTLFARRAHLDAIRTAGLRVQGPESGFVVQVAASDNVEDLTGAELVIVSVKSYSLGDVAPVVTTLARGGAIVLPLLNGVEAADHLADHGVPRETILGGLTFVNAHKAGPGIIHHAGWLQRVTLGEFDGSLSLRVADVAKALQSAEIEASPTTDIVAALWAKYNFICALSAACGMARSTVGAIRSTAFGRLLLTRAIAEIASVGRALGVAIADDAESTTLARIDGMHETQKPSFLIDVERGGPAELDIMSGAVARLGRRAGVETPIHDTAAAVLASFA